MKPKKVSGLRGRIISGPFGTGSKSEQMACFIECDESANRYLIRRKEGSAYDDAEIKNLIGDRVECDGFIVGTTLLVESIRPSRP